MLDQISANKRRAAALVAAVALIVGAVFGLVAGLILGTWVGLFVAVVLGGAVVAAAYRASDGVALSLTGAELADPVRFARLHNVVEGLCVAAGLPKPALYVLDDPAPNALALGRSPRHAAVVCTTGLVDKLTRIELEGVLAHELSHVKSYDTLAGTLAVTLVGLPARVLPFVRPGLLRLAVDDRREALADLSGVALTRYPPGLASALEKLQADSSIVHTTSGATDHLWLEPPGGAGIDDRIDVLKSL